MVPVQMSLSDLEHRFQGHDIIQGQITQKRYKLERTNRKSYVIYLSMTLNNP